MSSVPGKEDNPSYDFEEIFCNCDVEELKAVRYQTVMSDFLKNEEDEVDVDAVFDPCSVPQNLLKTDILAVKEINHHKEEYCSELKKIDDYTEACPENSNATFCKASNPERPHSFYCKCLNSIHTRFVSQKIFEGHGTHQDILPACGQPQGDV